MKRIVVLVLVMTMILVIAACGTVSNTESETQASSAEALTPAVEGHVTADSESESLSGSEASAEYSEEYEADVVPSEAEENTLEDPFGGYTLPLTREDVTFDWLLNQQMGFGAVPGYDDYNDVEALKYLEDETGVQLDVQGTLNLSQDMNLVIASGDYPDVLSGFGNSYSGSFDAAISEELILPLNDYMENLPVYSSYVKQYEDLRRNITTDEGNIWGFANFYTNNNGVSGLCVRQDLLDEQGLEIPSTLSELEHVLTVLRDAYQMNGPLLFQGTGTMSTFGLSYSWNSSFNVGMIGTIMGSPFINIDGKAIFTPITENWYNMLEVQADWYAKGLIYQDFASAGASSVMSLAREQKIAVYEDGTATMHMALDGLPDTAMIVGMSFPTNDINGDNEVIHVGARQSTVDTMYSACISTDVTDLEILLSFMDFLYTEEGHNILTYGIPDVSFEYDENGEPHFTDLIKNNPDGYAVSAMRVCYTLEQFPMWVDSDVLEREGLYREEAFEAEDRWNATDTDYNFPAVSLTTDENSIISVAYNDIITYAQEYLMKVTVGSIDLESTWQEYLDNIQAMDVDTVIQVYQDALDRYFAR